MSLTARLFRVLATTLVFFSPLAKASNDPKMDDCSYTVPVSRALLGRASFFLESTEWALRDGRRVFGYDIPADLVGGKKLHVMFLGPAAAPERGFATFTGEFGAASCTITPRVSCVVHYNKKLFADPAAAWRDAESHIRAKFASAPDLGDRLLVAHAFHQDPGAFLNLPAGD